MGELVNLQWALGTKQGQSRPRATQSCSPACHPACPVGSQTLLQHPGSGKQIKGFEWEEMSREELPGGEGWGARWSLEEGAAGIFHFHGLLLGL